MSRAGTPLMQQYREIKARHQDSILFFRMGDFYEMFYEDAETASRVLGLTLTSRNNGGAAEVPLAGVPVKAAADYLRRLVQQGFRVAICEQTEDPKLAKGLVKRAVVETITPGVVFADDILEGSHSNFIVAVHVSPQLEMTTRFNEQTASVGIAAADVSTGELRVLKVQASDAASHLARFTPREIVLAKGAELGPNGGVLARVMKSLPDTLTSERDLWEFDASLARDEVPKQFGIASLEGLGFDPSDIEATGALGALLRYLRDLQPAGLPHLMRPVLEQTGSAMPLDEMTRRNLELVESMRGGTEGTLLSVLDTTETPMGARLLKQWVLTPLTERNQIEKRLDTVTLLVHNQITRSELRKALDGVRDVERLAGKTASGRATPRDLRALGDSLSRVPEVFRIVTDLLVETSEEHAGVIVDLVRNWYDPTELSQLITNTLVERPPLQMGEEPTIANGVNEQLDKLRKLRDGGKDGIAAIQAEERSRTGISSLKVGYNRVFGYYIEISNANRSLVPQDYQRKQTLTGAERYITPALKEYEETILGAADKIETCEREIFDSLRKQAASHIRSLQSIAASIAVMDVLASLADTAERYQYVRPELHEGFHLHINAGRHPVVEHMMPRESFIPNDLSLGEDSKLIILTGPNMAGKSTVLRQTGLIQLMAQMGSFVPAKSAQLSIVDRLFTRVGASDNLARGQSTFMVEMSETSAILHTATSKSLVLLDEIGRGTATYDGVSIAWSVSEHLHDSIQCKTVFATHYHELTQLSEERSSVKNLTVAVRETGDKILFLHRLVPGGADRSYGIEVGRLAGLPEPVISRAKSVLALLEGDGSKMAFRLSDAVLSDGKSLSSGNTNTTADLADEQQLAFFVDETSSRVHDPVFEALADQILTADTDNMTPLQALSLVASLKTKLDSLLFKKKQ